MKKRRKKIIKQVASQDGIVSTEQLTYPIVHYPGFYGAFFAFQESESTPLYFCSCSYEAIKNYISTRNGYTAKNVNPTRNFILDSMYFPLRIITDLMKLNLTPEKVLENLRFKQNLCHECNKVIPSYSYCVDMYGSAFTQNYGWYINKQCYEYGITPISGYVFKEACPLEILEHYTLDPKEYFPKMQEHHKKLEFDEARNLGKQYARQTRIIMNLVEDEVRQKFGHKKIGEGWTSETILYQIICSLFPNCKILRHYRPKILEGLEFDIYIENLNLAIEYQGIQHYEPVEHWGGEDAFLGLQERDEKKKKIAASLKIPIVYFHYDENLNNEIVLAKLDMYIN